MSADKPSQAASSPLKVALAIAIFFPYGFYLLWNHPTLGKKPGWWIGGIAFVVLGMFAAGKGDTPAVNPEAPLTPGNLVKKAPARASKHKAPPITINLDKKSSEVRASYEEGFAAGVALAHELLDAIKIDAGRMDVKKYINEHPEVSADLEQLSFTLVQEDLALTSAYGNAIVSLGSRGVSKNLYQHPEVVDADKQRHFALGKMHAFKKVIDPVLKSK